MLKPVRMAAVELYVNDIGGSRKFFEEALGYPAPRGAAGYGSGALELRLRDAAVCGVARRGEPDRASLMAVDVTDVDRSRAGLEARGVSFHGPVNDSIIGRTSSFFAPEGQALTLYAPSEFALKLPSAAKLEALRGDASGGTDLRGRPVVYVFLFVTDGSRSKAFYDQVVGFPEIEHLQPLGVVKYDAGSVILCVHEIETQGDTQAARDDLAGVRAQAYALEVDDARGALARLSAAGVDAHRRGTGDAARWAFRDPDGHEFVIEESPSRAPGGRP